MPAEDQRPVSEAEGRRMAAELTLLEAQAELLCHQNERLEQRLALVKAASSLDMHPLLRDEAAAVGVAERAVDARLEKPEAIGFVDALARVLRRRAVVAEVTAATRRAAAALRKRTGAHSRWAARRHGFV